MRLVVTLRRSSPSAPLPALARHPHPPPSARLRWQNRHDPDRFARVRCGSRASCEPACGPELDVGGREEGAELGEAGLRASRRRVPLCLRRLGCRVAAQSSGAGKALSSGRRKALGLSRHERGAHGQQRAQSPPRPRQTIVVQGPKRRLRIIAHRRLHAAHRLLVAQPLDETSGLHRCRPRRPPTSDTCRPRPSDVVRTLLRTAAGCRGTPSASSPVVPPGDRLKPG